MTDGVEVLAHGGQGRDEVRRLGDVVEADDADIARDGPSRLRQRAHQSKRHLVIGAEDGGELAVTRDLPAELEAAACGPVAHDVLGRAESGGVHRVPPPGEPGPCLGPRRRPCHVCDLSVAQLDEVLGAGDRSGELVDADRPARTGVIAFDDHHRHSDLHLGPRDLECLVGRGDQDDPLDTLVAQVLDRLGQLVPGHVR